MRYALTAHVILLVLASTAFTAVTAFTSGTPLEWCSYSYASESGFGYQYVSDFSLAQVVTYLGAFVFGLIGFSGALRRGQTFVGTAGVLFSLIGIASFGIEGSHWFMDHNTSWTAFSPAAMLVLAPLAFLNSFRKTDRKDDAVVEAESVRPARRSSARRNKPTTRIGFDN